MDPKVIFQDDDILVLDKPAGLVVDKSNTQNTNTLEDILKKDFNIHLKRSGIVHRLDKDTSGIILIARTQEAMDALQAQFKQRQTRKEYLALVHGLVEKGGVVEAAIGRNPGNREKFTTWEKSLGANLGHPPGVREAVTEYIPEGKFQISNDKFQIIFNDLNKIQARKLERMKYNEFTLLHCFPKTGRTHQIRVHLKYINHPVVCDETYVGRKIYRLDHRWCPRQFLHATKLGFYHPKSGEWMEVESPLPEDLTNCLKLLKSNLSS